ncbi:LysR family transcriptional regulator [Streptomyces sp. NPDC059460]|uniref:LysR family transcriptional regulator n=1 Tax=Streptomyces sp. NPDC059460 TaxID=3346840 RepID=UPI0036A4CFEF
MKQTVLQYFTNVALLGSVSRAAEKLGVTQPTVSRQLASLESELGTRLFTRASTGLDLTPAGRSFLPVARDILARMERGAELVQAVSKGRHFGITAVGPTTTMHYVLSPFLADTGAPLVDVRDTVPDLVYEQVLDGTADFAVNTRRAPLELTERPLVEVPVSVQWPPGGPWEGRSEIEMPELRGMRVVVPGKGSAVRGVFDAAARRIGLDIEVHSVTSAPVAQASARAGRGPAIVIEPRRFGLEGAHLTLDGRRLTVTLYAAWNPDHYAAPELAAVADQLARWSADALTDPLRW